MRKLFLFYVSIMLLCSFSTFAQKRPFVVHRNMEVQGTFKIDSSLFLSDSTLINSASDLVIQHTKTLHSSSNDTLFSVVVGSDSVYSAVIDYAAVFRDATHRQLITGRIHLTVAISGGDIDSARIDTVVESRALTSGTISEDFDLLSYNAATHRLYVIVKYETSLSATVSRMYYWLGNSFGDNSIVYY